MDVTIEDLLDVIHKAIIKNKGENKVILKELRSIDNKIKTGKLENYKVDDITYWKHLIYIANQS
jgi:hypothetical protein